MLLSPLLLSPLLSPLLSLLSLLSMVGVYYICMVFIWLPLFIFFACLTAKLSGEDSHNANREMKLAAIFVPLWLIEMFFMASTLGFLLHGIVKYFNGIIERIDEHISLFGVCWAILTPFVIFQILMCVRDEQGNITAVDVCSPLLVLFLVLFLLALQYARCCKSAFDVIRETRREDDIGSRLLFEC